MKHINTTGVVLGRINYREADRIIKVITPDFGKVSLMARGVRKIKSKLAGGIELFSISTLSFIQGSGEISTLTSTRLQTHFSNIIQDYPRTSVGYEVLSLLDKTTEDSCGTEYYHLLVNTLSYLDNLKLDSQITRCWFLGNLLKILGHYPNVVTDIDNIALTEIQQYDFDYQNMAFVTASTGRFNKNHIKILRMLIDQNPTILQHVSGVLDIMNDIQQILARCIKQTTS